MYVLRLHDIRLPEGQFTEVCMADKVEDIVALLDRERVESYLDGTLLKHHKKGGPLEFYDAPQPKGAVFNIFTADHWAERARKEYTEYTSKLTPLSQLVPALEPPTPPAPPVQ